MPYREACAQPRRSSAEICSRRHRMRLLAGLMAQPHLLGTQLAETEPAAQQRAPPQPKPQKEERIERAMRVQSPIPFSSSTSYVAPMPRTAYNDRTPRRSCTSCSYRAPRMACSGRILHRSCTSNGVLRMRPFPQTRGFQRRSVTQGDWVRVTFGILLFF